MSVLQDAVEAAIAELPRLVEVDAPDALVQCLRGAEHLDELEDEVGRDARQRVREAAVALRMNGRQVTPDHRS